LTPETSDVSDLATSESGTEHGDSSDTATEVGAHSDAEYDADTSFTSFRSLSLSERYGVDTDDEEPLSERFGTLQLNGGAYGLSGLHLNGDANALHRTTSQGSSAYASSEGGSEAGLAGSMFAPSEPALSPQAGTVGLPSFPEMPRRLPGNADWTDKPTFFEYVYGA